VPIHDPIPDDEHFERYLKQFHPLAPGSLPLKECKNRRAWSPLAPAWTTVAAVVIFASLILYPRVRYSGPRDEGGQWAGVAHAAPTQPLTIESANALLTHAPSFKAAVDAIAVPSRTTSFAGKQSALDVLSKDSKL
jgi:hypothetical protein